VNWRQQCSRIDRIPIQTMAIGNQAGPTFTDADERPGVRPHPSRRRTLHPFFTRLVLNMRDMLIMPARTPARPKLCERTGYRKSGHAEDLAISARVWLITRRSQVRILPPLLTHDPRVTEPWGCSCAEAAWWPAVPDLELQSERDRAPLRPVIPSRSYDPVHGVSLVSLCRPARRCIREISFPARQRLKDVPVPTVIP
jgi:hypothetical protein